MENQGNLKSGEQTENFKRVSSLMRKTKSLENDKRLDNVDVRSSLINMSENAMIQRQINNLVKALSARTERAKDLITRPITPDGRHSPIQDEEEPNFRSRENSIFEKALPFDLSSRMSTPFSISGPITEKFSKCSRWLRRPINSQGLLYTSWQFIILICFLYNSVGILLRVVFPYQTPTNLKYWLLADYTADAFYIMDLFLKFRVKLIVKGNIVSELTEIPKYYITTTTFKFDVLSLTPLDLLYFYFGISPLLRFPRMLKIEVFWDFFNKCDRKAKNPYIVRIVRIFSYMLYLNHLIGCAYYAVSKYKGLGTNSWAYDGVGNAYIRCFLFGLKAATSIGKNPKPTEQDEYMFMTTSWLAGVFIFAILIGQIRDILSNSTQVKEDYRERVDRVHAYMQHMNIPQELQDRINIWFNYNWQENKGMDEEIVLNQLPKKMKSDLALYIHFNTLKKVQLFRGLETELLKELVLRLKPMLFLPGDYVCKKGDVGSEMYIVNSGKIQVLGGVSGNVVLATLGEGSVFGEVSLLALAGGNRRNADVRSQGYSDMFVLTKRCLQEAVRDFPGAQEILQHKARKLMNNNQKKLSAKADDRTLNAAIIGNPKRAPHLAQTVLQVISQSAVSLQQTNKTNLPSNPPLLSKQNESRSNELNEAHKQNYQEEKSYEPISEANSDLENENIETQQFSLEDIRDALDSESYDSLSSSTLSLVSYSSDDERRADEIQIAKHETNNKLINPSK